MTTHLTYPLTTHPIGDGTFSFAVVEQDSDDDIRGGALLLCDVRPRQLAWAPAMGTPSLLGEADPVAAAQEITAALAQHEPRAPITAKVVDYPESGRKLFLRLEVTP